MRRRYEAMDAEQRTIIAEAVELDRDELRAHRIRDFAGYTNFMFNPAQPGDAAYYANAHLEGRELAMSLSSFVIIELQEIDLLGQERRSASIYTPEGELIVS